MKSLMIVATSVATDARVLKEATTLVEAGHTVHVIGKNVPTSFQPPTGVTVSSVGASSVLRREGGASLTGTKLSAPVALARWAMLPTHRNSTFRRFADAAEQIAVELSSDAPANERAFDVVHAHDFTALEASARVAARAGVPLVYDSHEFWGGRSREYRPTPLQDARERRVEARLGGQAAAVITVGDGVAAALREQYAGAGWPAITVVRNSFPPASDAARARWPELPQTPRGVIYAGRIGAHRELETVAAASPALAADGLTTTLMGPVDATWLGGFEPGAITLVPPTDPDEVDAHLREVGLVLVALAPGWKNHELALPNKLFHAVRAGVPMVASDLGELAAVVRRYNLGTLYTPGDAASLRDAVRRAVAEYGSYKASVANAAHELSWAGDGAALVEVYAGLGNPAPPQLPRASATPQTHRTPALPTPNDTFTRVATNMRAQARRARGKVSGR